MKSIPFKIRNGKFIVNPISRERFVKANDGKEGDLIIQKKKRTLTQNNALHLFYQHLADALNNAGLDMRVVLKPTFNIPWSTFSVKEYLWRPLQKSLLKKESTTDLNKLEEIDKVHEVLMRELGEKHGVEYVEFPHKCSQCHQIDCLC